MPNKENIPFFYDDFNPVIFFIKRFIALSVGAGATVCAGVCFLFLWLNSSLPPIEKFSTRVRTPSVTIQAVDGTILANYGDLFEEFLNVSDLPPHVINALLAVEDRRFYVHNGIDIIGVVRAMITNLRANRIVQGGSTLTQQLAKNMLMSSGFYRVSDRSIQRKLHEIILAIKLETRFCKNEILTLYLNRVYFGAATYGIDAAARRYFGKSGKELTLFEAAVLAGLLRAPSRFSPTANPKKSVERAKFVLAAMEASGFIDASWREHIEEWEQSFVQMVYTSEKGSRYFADWVFETIPSIIGPIEQDLTVVTTLNPDMQHQTEEICAKYYKEHSEEYKFAQMAVVAMTPSGAVLAMIGGVDYGKSQFNRATSARRQSGSAFKTFVYLAALEAGIDMDEKFDDSAFEQGTWKPGNYKWKSLGEVSMLEAYVSSVNSVCLRVAQQIGIRAVIKTAKRLGITSPINSDLTIAIGSSELTLIECVRAYAPFFNNGYMCWPYGILEIRDKNGEILYQRTKDVTTRVIEEKPLADMKTMMRSVVQRGTGRAANVDSNVMGKTGSNSNRDAWFFGGRHSIAQNQEDQEQGNEESIWIRDNKFAALSSEDNYNYELSSKVIADQEGIVLGVWIGNDSAGKKMAPMSTGGRIPARIAASLLRAYMEESAERKGSNGGGNGNGGGGAGATNTGAAQKIANGASADAVNKSAARSIDQLLNFQKKRDKSDSDLLIQPDTLPPSIIEREAEREPEDFNIPANKLFGEAEGAVVF
ncbi:MAG: transglycosylase domain-containing protein [Holosporales bacterium]|jgi:penicillin-binding protein 1A|nr:transglycosylase domain-containing protein [Holosporales bacterium]